MLNIRLLPGNTVSPLLAKLQTLVNDPEIRFEVQPNAGETAPSSSVTSDLYNMISQVAKQQFPGAVVVPEMSTGATDSVPLRLRNVQAYGLLPFPDDRIGSRAHALPTTSAFPSIPSAKASISSTAWSAISRLRSNFGGGRTRIKRAAEMPESFRFRIARTSPR